MTTPQLSSADYDAQWAQLRDFIRFNPGARSRRRLIRKELSNLPTPDSILDAGCGLGYTIADLRDVCGEAAITGMDFSADAIQWAAERFPSDEWICADITQLKLNRTFDVVVCTEVIEHIEDVDLVLANLCMLTTPGGCLILTTQAGRVHATERFVGHIRHFERSDLIRKLTELGMVVERSAQWGWPGMSMLKYIANVKPKTTIARLGSGEYSRLMRFLNHLAYAFVRLSSLPSSRLGCQIVITVRRIPAR